MADRFLLRRVWFQVHLWIGVALFLVLIPLSVTGSLLVWHDALDEVVNPQRYQVTGPANRPLQAYADAARGVLGDGQPVASIRMPEHGHGPIVVLAPIERAPGAAPQRGRAPSMNVWIDPGSARVLDTGRSDEGVVRWLHMFHGTLMIPGMGRKIVGWLGWLMLASSLTGIWLWWPRNHKLAKAFRWRRAPLTSSNLHHLVGFWVSLPLAMLALTGAWISFPQMFRSVVAAATGEPAPPAKGGPGGPGGPGGGGGGRPVARPQLTPDQAAAAVRAAAPGGEIVSVGYPTRRKAAWAVRVQPPGLMAATYSVDDATGAAKAEGRKPDAAARTARLMRVLHDGSTMGLVWQVVIFVAGLAPALLGITGVIMWLKNRGGRRARNSWKQDAA
jgi:uncharacterized iron-regulated membrane protein